MNMMCYICYDEQMLPITRRLVKSFAVCTKTKRKPSDEGKQHHLTLISPMHVKKKKKNQLDIAANSTAG